MRTEKKRARAWRRVRAGCVSLAAVALAGLAARADGERVTLVFDEPVSAMINARRWDETHHQWHQGEPGERFFDAVHRFLLVRFPDSAEGIHAKLAKGFDVERATLSLRWERQEWARVEGYACRQWSLVRAGREPARWHARVEGLLRPWTDDPDLGPTWNAYLRGAGFWTLGGARAEDRDRFAPSLGVMGLWEAEPDGELDVIRLFTSHAYGATLAERLRVLADCGFLIRRDEIANREFGSYAASTGAARIWVTTPRLTVVLRRADTALTPGPLPASADPRALADRLRASGEGGRPTTVIPDNFDALAAAAVAARRDAMPDWMWARVEEVMRVRHASGYAPWFRDMAHALDSGDPEAIRAAMDDILSRPPGWSQGHQRLEFSLPLYHYGALLPDVIHYHLRTDFVASLPHPLEDPYKLWAIASMGTLNHMAQARPTWLLGAQVAGQDRIVEAAHYGLSLLNRQMIFNDGFSAEHGDSYYRGITLAPLRAAARFAADPVIRLKAALMVEKLLFEDISTYHPGLRKRVSRISRRAGGLYQLLLAQDVPEAVLHTLSREGVLFHLDAPGDKPEVNGVPVFDLSNTPAARVALLAPWGAEWEANTIDRKPIPFRAVAGARMFGGLSDSLSADEPVHIMTYMGANYALGSEELPSYSFVPVFGAWRRAARPVAHLEEFGILLLQGRLNDDEVNAVEKTPFGALQHDNKLLWVAKMPERKFVIEGHSNLPAGVKEGVRRFRAQVGLVAHGAGDAIEVHVNGERIRAFPAAARQGDAITIRDGVSYIGLLAPQATDLGRKQEIAIAYDPPILTVSAFVMDRDEPVRGDDDEMWARMAHATAAWAVEFGDEDEHEDFAAFQRHIAQARAEARWDGDASVLHLGYRSGNDELELGFRTDWARDCLWHDQRSPSQVFAYRRVNGAWPWLPDGIMLDNPLGQMGRAERLEKGGAVLLTREGQTAFLRMEPISGTVVGINPFMDPTPFELITPEGVRILAEGSLGLARIEVNAVQGFLLIDAALPAVAGNAGLARLREQQPQWFHSHHAFSDFRAASARTLLVSGLGDAPRVTLNGRRVPGPFARVTAAGVTHIRVPIVTALD